MIIFGEEEPCQEVELGYSVTLGTYRHGSFSLSGVELHLGDPSLAGLLLTVEEARALGMKLIDAAGKASVVFGEKAA